MGESGILFWIKDFPFILPDGWQPLRVIPVNPVRQMDKAGQIPAAADLFYLYYVIRHCLVSFYSGNERYSFPLNSNAKEQKNYLARRFIGFCLILYMESTSI